MKGDFKKCTGCGEEKPATAEFFYRDRRKKGGLRTKCKDCKRKYQNQRRKEHPEKCKAQMAAVYKYRKKRRKEDPVYRLNCYMRSGLSNCLSGKQKNSHTFDYIGLTPKELMDYL